MTSRIRRRVPFVLLSIFMLFTAPVTAAELNCQDAGSTLLWEAKGRNSTVHLFGSLHLGSPSFYPLAPEIESRFREADNLVFELDPSSLNSPQSQALMLQAGSLPAGQRITDVLSPEVLEALNARMSALGVPPQNFQQFRPWFVTMLLGSLQYMAMGYLPDNGVEQYIIREAGAASILELETLEEQLTAFQSMDGEAFLAYTLNNFDRDQKLAEKLIQAWRCADKPALNELMAMAFEADGELAEQMAELEDKLLVQRNHRMATTIHDYLQNGSGNYFVVVGSAHLLGEGNIVELLRARDYQVTAVRR